MPNDSPPPSRPLTGSALTAAYLDEVQRQGAKARELIGSQVESERLNAFYGGRYLPRPLFVSYPERVQLETDLLNLRSALVSLPGKLYGGNLARFARDVGMTDVQISAITRGRAQAVTMQTRADLYVDSTGFRLLEYNMGSAIGGMDNPDMCRSLLEHPLLASFARRHGLEYIDTLEEEVVNRLAETGSAAGSRPMMATTDWPVSYQTLAPYMRLYNARLQQMGIDAHPCHIGQLTVRDERVWLGDRAVDVVDRLFMVEDLLDPDASALVDPILDAAARGWVKIFTPLNSGLFASKGALAMLSDERNRPLFDPDVLVSLDRILPWTRMVRPGQVTLEDGRRADLLGYALSHRDDLVLKPTLLHGGQGVVLGWSADVTPQSWEEQVRAAMDGPYVLQRRVRPVPELFPGEDGELVPWIVCWGAYTGVSGFTGIWSRAVPVEANIEVVNLAVSHVGPSLFAGPEGGEA